MKLNVQKKKVTCDINTVYCQLYCIISYFYIFFHYIYLAKPIWHKRALVINHEAIVAQGEDNRNRIDAAKAIAQVTKESKAVVLLKKRKERAESKLSGLETQGEKLARTIAKSDKEKTKNEKALEDQRNTLVKTELEQKFRHDKGNSDGSLTMHEKRVLNNQFEIDMYVEALRHYKAYYKISGEKNIIAADSDVESDEGGDH